MHVPNEKAQIQYQCLMHIMSATLQVPFESYDFGDIRNIKKRMLKLQLEACLISQGLTLIFTQPVYTKDGLSQKTSLQYFILCDDLRLVSSFMLQSLKSYIFFYRLTIGHTLKIRSCTLRSTTKYTHQWACRLVSTHLHTHIHRETHDILLSFFDRRTAVKTDY